VDAVAAIAALAGVFLGAVATYLVERRHQNRVIRDRWTERASDALADVNLLLTSSFPRQIAWGSEPRTARSRVKKVHDMSEPVRREVAALAAGHPDRKVRDLATNLEITLFYTVDRLEAMVQEMIVGEDTSSTLTEAEKEYEDARALAKGVADRIHA
jgi:hypothetical protein